MDAGGDHPCVLRWPINVADERVEEFLFQWLGEDFPSLLEVFEETFVVGCDMLFHMFITSRDLRSYLLCRREVQTIAVDECLAELGT